MCLFAALRSGHDKPFKFRQGQWPAIQVTLVQVAAVELQERLPRLVLDPFGNHIQAQARGQGDDGLGNDRVVAIVRQIRDKGPVDFELIERQSARGVGRLT